MKNVTTLVLFVKDGQVLLGKKKRGFATGKWNGYGGKLLPGETVKQSAVREVSEESGIQISEENLIEIGQIDFLFDDKPEYDQRVMIYRVDEWEGDAVESEEMIPRWFPFEEVPYDEMWIDDQHWYPYFIRRENFIGTMHFADEGKRITSIDLKPLDLQE